jgi:hypothetical protein
MADSTRRAIFGELFVGLARAAEQRLPAALAEHSPWVVARPPRPPGPEPVPPTRGTVSEERLDELIEACGLAGLEAEIRALGVRGARLAPEPGAEAEALDPTGVPAAVLVDLAGLPALSTISSGSLRVELPWAAAPPGPVAVKVSTADLGPEGALVPSPELTLPRAWSAPAQALGLTSTRVESWELLRARLAKEHGVELTDGPARSLAVHRLLGYPDERRGQMPVWCELLERGTDLGGEPVFMHPAAPEAEEAASRWRLLLQVSPDPRLGWRWGAGAERLYVWLPGEDLEVGRLDRARGFVQ